MRRPLVTIPPSLMRVLNCNWDIDWRGQSAGTNTAGTTGTIHNEFPRWVCSLNLILHGAELGQWRALRAAAQGRVGIYRVTMVDPVGYSNAALGVGVPFSTGETFDTGSGFLYVPTCTATLAAAAGATTIRVTSDETPADGQIMSHNDWPFVVTYVHEVSTGVYDLDIQMPLRAAISAGDEINKRGIGQFEVTEGGSGAVAYDASQIAPISLSFQEALNR